MHFAPLLTTILGLILFEIVSGVDNAVINAEVLASLPLKNRRWFLRWGLLFAVLGMRGVLPWLIVWLAVPAASSLDPLTPSYYQTGTALQTLQGSAELLLLTAGVSLLLIFLYWACVEHAKNRQARLQRAAAFTVSSCFLVGGLLTITDGMAHRAIAIGVILFLVLILSKQLAAVPRERMSRTAGNRAKMVYLEVLDSIFSVEAVLGAFAFTFSVPLILIGNGIGAILVRLTTAVHGPKIRKLLFLKRGAMYALGLLAIIMILDGLGAGLPGWLSFLTTLIGMGLAFLQR